MLSRRFELDVEDAAELGHGGERLAREGRLADDVAGAGEVGGGEGGDAVGVGFEDFVSLVQARAGLGGEDEFERAREGGADRERASGIRRSTAGRDLGEDGAGGGAGVGGGRRSGGRRRGGRRRRRGRRRGGDALLVAGGGAGGADAGGDDELALRLGEGAEAGGLLGGGDDAVGAGGEGAAGAFEDEVGEVAVADQARRRGRRGRAR